MELFSEYESKKKVSAYSKCVEIWLTLHKGWAFGAVHGRKLKSIIKKIEQSCKAVGLAGDDEQKIAAWMKMCLWISQDEYYKFEDLQVIDSHYNKIVTKIQHGKSNGKEKWSSKTSTQRIIDDL